MRNARLLADTEQMLTTGTTRCEPRSQWTLHEYRHGEPAWSVSLLEAVMQGKCEGRPQGHCT